VAWVLAVPALHQASPERPSHVDVPLRAAFVLSQGLVPLEGFTWHGYSRCPLYIKRAPSDLLTSMSLRGLLSFGAKGSCRSRVLPQAGPGRPSHADVPSRVAFVSSQGLVPLEGFAWHGRPRCLLYFKQVPGGPLTLMSHRGLPLSRAGGSCRSRVLRGMGAHGACFTSSRSRAALSRRCPIEGCLCLEPGVRPARGFSLLGKGPGH
jgi:hypothetical protein